MSAALNLQEKLHAIPLFSGIDTPRRSELLAQGRLRQLNDRTKLFVQGDSVSSFYILVDGTIQLFRESPDGHEKTLDLLHYGQTLGATEIMDACSSYRAHARSVGDSAVLEYQANNLKEMAQQNGTLALNLLAAMADQAHQAELEAEQQARMSAAQLVACFMQRLCILFDYNPAGFDLPYSKTLIASRLGLEIETFSRTLHKLRDNGMTITGNHVVIQNFEALSEYVCESCSISRECMTRQKLARKLGEEE